MSLEEPEAEGPDGWAVEIDGVIAIRTASYCEEAAMINGLVLLADVHPYATGGWSEERIRNEFDLRLILRKDKTFRLVPVICQERKHASPA